MWLIAKLIIKIRTQPVHRDYVQSLKICKGTTTACRGTGMSLLQNFPVEFFHFYLSFFKVILRNNKWPHTIKWWIDSTWEHESVHVLEHLSIRSSCVWWLLTSTPALIFHYKLTWGWCSCWWRPADSGGRTYFCCCSDPCDAPFRIPPELHETWRLK